MRRSLTWLVAVPLAPRELAGGALPRVPHRYPGTPLRARVLLATGHGYLDRLPLVLGAAGAIALVALLVAAIDASRGQAPRALPPWAFALLAPAAFVIQEYLERSLHAGTFAWHTAAAPTFLPGLLAQVPFALSRGSRRSLLLRAAAHAGRALAARPPQRAAGTASRPPSLPPGVAARRACSRGRSPSADRLSSRPFSAGRPRTARPIQRSRRRRGMTRVTRSAVFAAAALASLAVAAAASAHARVSPPVVLAKVGQVFTLAVPTEKDGATTTTVELTPPHGFSIDSFVAVARLEAQRCSRRAPARTAVDHEGDLERRSRSDRGGRRASVPRPDGASTGTYTFGVRQTYSDGTVVTGPGPSRPTRRRRSSRRCRRSAAAARRRSAIVGVALAAIALVVAVAGLAARRGPDGRMTVRLLAAVVALAAGVAAVVVVMLLLSSRRALSDAESDSRDAAGRSGPTSSTSSSPSRSATRRGSPSTRTPFA